MTRSGERAPLLAAVASTSHSDREAHQTADEAGGDQEHGEAISKFNPRLAISSIIAMAFSVALVIVAVLYIERLPDDPERAAIKILERAQIIDGHIDLPIMVRAAYRNNLTKFNMRERSRGHVDIPRLRAGKVGGFFWSVYVGCADTGSDFMTPANRVRDTLEQIDVSTLLIEEYSDTFELVTSSKDLQQAMRIGKIASLIGVEGGHQLGNSIGVLRQYYALGARYMTLTHSCNNVFADSAGIFEPIPTIHGGLSSFGEELVREMNRIGMLVDLSHVSDETAIQALKITKAPVIWSHSSVRAYHNITRNVPDHILRMIGTEPGQKDGVVMVNLYPRFLSSDVASVNVATVADHIDHVGNVAGRKHVGIGSDFDGIEVVPQGLEDVSRYPALFAELLRRGWTRAELEGLASKNFIRVFQGAEAASVRLKAKTSPSYAIYDKRNGRGGSWSDF